MAGSGRFLVESAALMMRYRYKVRGYLMNRKNRCVLEIDKELTPFLFNAIIAIKNSEWSKLYDVENFYLIFNPIIRKTENVEFYTITFLSEKSLKITGWI